MRWGGITAVLARACPRGDRRRALVGFICFFSLSFRLFCLWCASQFLGTSLGGGRRGVCNMPPLRGQRTANGLYIISP